MTDTRTFDVEGLLLQRKFRKHQAGGRFFDELAYGELVIDRIALHSADVVISANTTLITQALVQRFCRKHGIAFVFWQQDILSLGMRDVVSSEHKRLGQIIGKALAGVECRIL